ncbi:SgcJ/EcaC family oxidoreductase [Agrobacterium vitis]|uniref:SgcJ/EcaC family oxidoreductase n=1 Tax=Agrobacterium vitis TaxID=373 RepID=A0A6L6VNV9_AGRVI|nr:nuclear transport factor 2 family protein [Agrobacterium vitis]MUZ76009.1 SgcJ/EcaC family oxidoreductase [Agrobacterium vitis]
MDNAKLQQLVDESDLRKLIGELPRNLDKRDWDAIGSLFVEDAVFFIKGEERKGREAIVAGPSRDLEPLYESTYHHLGQIYTNVDGDTAEIVAYCVAYHMHSKSDFWNHADVGGRYNVEAVRTEEGWRIKRLHLDFCWFTGMPFGAPAPAK